MTNAWMMKSLWITKLTFLTCYIHIPVLIAQISMLWTLLLDGLLLLLNL